MQRGGRLSLIWGESKPLLIIRTVWHSLPKYPAKQAEYSCAGRRLIEAPPASVGPI